MNDENKDMNFDQNENAASETQDQTVPETPMTEMQANDESADIEVEPKIEAVKKRGIGKVFIKVALTVLSCLVIFSLVASAAYSAVSNYVLFPDFDEALANSLENKFDLGTEFDFSALTKEGKIELEMYPSKDEAEDSDIDKVIASISYNGLNEASMKLTVGDQIANAYVNENALAANLEGFNGGDFYGISLEDIVDRLEGSFFDPEEKSDYVSLTDAQFDTLQDTLETFLEMKEQKKEYQKDMAVIMSVIEEAFNDSKISEYDTSYGGVKVLGEERSARCKRYEFDLQDVVDFIERVADEFDDPSPRLEDAVENLFDNDASPFATLFNGYDCDDIVDELDSLADEIDAVEEDVSFVVLLAYSGNAITTIQVKVDVKDVMSAIGTLDFGASPKKEKGMIVNVDVTDLAQDNGKMNIRLSTELEENKDKSEARMTLSVDLPDEKNEISFCAEFDRADEKATISANTKMTLKEGGDELTTESGEEELFKFTFKMLDTKSKFSLTVDELIANGEKAEDIDGEITLNFYRKPDSTRMPRFEDVVDMKVRSFDRLCDDLVDYLEDLGEEYEALFDIDISNVQIPSIDLPFGEEPEPDDDDMGIIGGQGDGVSVDEIANGDYIYKAEDGTYNEVYNFYNGRYYFVAYDATVGEEVYSERGDFYLYNDRTIVFCPDDAESYEAAIAIYSNRLVMFDMEYKKIG